MSPETRIRQLVIVAAVIVAALFVGFLVNKWNRKKRPKAIVRFPGRW
jgi:hypothetical protein